MKVAFLNSCLEPGRDGVGDYTRSLAQECVQQGHECCTVALNDRYVSEPVADEGEVTTLRLPNDMPWPERIRQARSLLDTFAPDWVSLQFVPYAFQSKGLPFGLGRRLQPLVKGRRSQIMFHELSIGAQTGASVRHKLVGLLQQHLIKQLIKQWQPSLIHTSNSTYIARLERQGIAAKLLPLFGSIPIADGEDDGWLLAELRKAGLVAAKQQRDDFWFAGFFGSIPPFWPSEPIFTYLQQAAVEAKRQVVIWSIGHLGSGQQLWNNLVKQYSSCFVFCALGEQPEQQVSQFLNSIDFGFAAAPESLIGKSSSTVAMLEHGVPVIVNRDDEHFGLPAKPDLSNEPLLHLMSKHQERVIETLPLRGVAASRLPKVAHQFISDLSHALGN